jgi:hypothetical protein
VKVRKVSRMHVIETIDLERWGSIDAITVIFFLSLERIGCMVKVKHGASLASSEKNELHYWSREVLACSSLFFVNCM